MANKTDNVGDRSNDSSLETIVIINCALNAALMLISIIGNTLVLAAILRTPSLRSPSMILLCSLAVSDLLVALVEQPLYIINEITKNSLFKVSTTMAFAACGVSLLTMTAISVDRFLALHYHMRYPNLMTTHRVMYTSATVWITTFLLSFVNFLNPGAFYFTIAVCIAISILVSTVFYIRIYRVVRQHQLQIHAQQQAMESINSENDQRARKSAINTFIFFIAMIFCYTPVFIGMIILVISPRHWTKPWDLTETLAFMNSSINPCLYCWRLRELRKAVLKTARQMLCKQSDEN